MTESAVFKTLSIDELETGMFVTTLIIKNNNSNVKNQGRVNSQQTIDSLKKQGVTEVIIKCDAKKNKPIKSSFDADNNEPGAAFFCILRSIQKGSGAP